MMQKGLIGVIVPVYKVEKYIAECIESILAQTYTKFRLILVDDGTPDNAGKICDEDAKKDSRITVIHQENAGVTRARARGVEEADDCEFITFVDGDDTLPSTALQELYYAINENHDMVFTDNVLDYPSVTTDSITRSKFQELLLSEKISSAPWGKLFRRHLFNNFTFDISRKIVMGEDLVMNLRIADYCKKNIRVIHTLTYNYNIHQESICHNFKDSAEHEYLLYSSMTCITDLHPELIIKYYLTRWNRRFDNSYKKPLWYYSRIHKTLISDIEKYNYNIGVIEYILFKTSNPIIRFLAIYFKKIQNKILTITK